MEKEVPRSLKIWFRVHFLIDFFFAIPLFFAPRWLLAVFGFAVVTPALARLVGAALFGIGISSLFTKTREQFQIMLTLKIFWSLTAIIGLLWSLAEGAPYALWTAVVIFILFLGIWSYYKWQR